MSGSIIRLSRPAEGIIAFSSPVGPPGPGPAAADTPNPGPAGLAAIPAARPGRATPPDGENDLRPDSGHPSRFGSPHVASHSFAGLAIPGWP